MCVHTIFSLSYFELNPVFASHLIPATPFTQLEFSAF